MRTIASGKPGSASGILVLEHAGQINGRDQAASFAGNESKKRMANSDLTSYV
jgi:hypothetical protein